MSRLQSSIGGTDRGSGRERNERADARRTAAAVSAPASPASEFQMSCPKSCRRPGGAGASRCSSGTSFDAVDPTPADDVCRSSSKLRNHHQWCESATSRHDAARPRSSTADSPTG